MSPLLQVFARAPVAGACKTRLMPALGPEGAAALQRNLTRHTLRTASSWRDALPGAEVELWCAPDANHPFFAACAAEFGLMLRVQADGDLGARMWLALMDALCGGRTPLLIGTDCPRLSTRDIIELHHALASHDCGFIGAEDGGYVAVGLARAVPQLFAGVAWGTDRVMAQTRERALAAGASLVEVNCLPDVDVAEDLARLREDAALAHLLPAVAPQ